MSITETNLLTELRSRGYNATVNDVIKNGVTLRGLTIKENDSQNIAPCIYIDKMLNDFDSPHEAADAIINIYRSHRTIDLGCDISDLTNPDYILSHAYIGLQKNSLEDIIRRPSPYDGIEEFLYLRGEADGEGNRWSVKLKPAMISDIETDNLWKTAEERTFRGFQIHSLRSVLAGFGFCEEDSIPETLPMYIITNPEKFRGAALACDMQSIRAWAKEHDYSKAVILPSSVHEMLLVPVEDECDLETFNLMVKEVNETQVDPTERLTDRAYLINLKEAA